MATSRRKILRRAGTKELIKKESGVLAKLPCSSLYVVSNFLGQYFPVNCFSRSLEFFWQRETISDNTWLTPAAYPVQPHQVRIYNNQILYIGNSGDTDNVMSRVWVHDLGLNRDKVVYIDSLSGMFDGFTTSDGKIFALLSGQDGMSITCFEADGTTVATVDIGSYFLGGGTTTMIGKSDSDGTFRIYVVGYKGASDPDRLVDEQTDSVVCLTFNGTTFSHAWTWYDDDPSELIGATGREWQLYVPDISEDTDETCYLVSMVLGGDGWTSTCEARVSVIEAGTRLHYWDIPLNDDESSVNYIAVGEIYFSSPVGFSIRANINCALRYSNCNYYLYLRACSDLKPSSMYKLNLTTGSAAEQITTLTLSDGERPSLIGLPDSSHKPNNWSKLATIGLTSLSVVDIDSPTVALSTATIDTGYVDRPGYSGYKGKFLVPRINQDICVNW